MTMMMMMLMMRFGDAAAAADDVGFDDDDGPDLAVDHEKCLLTFYFRQVPSKAKMPLSV